MGWLVGADRGAEGRVDNTTDRGVTVGAGARRRRGFSLDLTDRFVEALSCDVRVSADGLTCCTMQEGARAANMENILAGVAMSAGLVCFPELGDVRAADRVCVGAPGCAGTADTVVADTDMGMVSIGAVC